MKLIAGNYYAVTINPSLKHDVSDDKSIEAISMVPEWQFINCFSQRMYLQAKIATLSLLGDVFDINYEFTPNRNRHAHFTFRPNNDQVKLFEKTFRSYLGFSERECKVKIITDVSKWVDYCQKESVPSKPLF